MEHYQPLRMDRTGLKPLPHLLLAVEHRQITQLQSLRGLIGKTGIILLGWITHMQLACRPAHGRQPANNEDSWKASSGDVCIKLREQVGVVKTGRLWVLSYLIRRGDV